MSNFDAIFSGTRERPVKYKENYLVRFDDVPFEDGDRFLITFEKKNSEWRQGIALDIFGTFEINGKQYQNKVVLWEDNSPKETIVTLYKEKSDRYHSKRLPKKGMLGIKNIWDTGKGSIDSWIGGAAMIIEEIKSGKRYRCNDGHPDENFDDIVFTIQKVGQNFIV